LLQGRGDGVIECGLPGGGGAGDGAFEFRRIACRRCTFVQSSNPDDQMFTREKKVL
jgi:hypothetical protein